MKFKKLYFIFDKTIKAQACKKDIFKNYKNQILKKSDIIVVLGGDGFMLQTLKKYSYLNKPFYGMNRGTFGFLMNKYRKNKILNTINKAKKVEISPLKMIAHTRSKFKKKAFAFNEISLLRQSKQTAYLEVHSKKKKIIKKLISDGILVATPAGSTAYNLSVSGPILPLNSKKLAITAISPFRPRRWKGTLVNSNSNIFIRNLDTSKRPISAVADNVEFRNVKSINIKLEKRKKIILLYDSVNSLTKKNKAEQWKKQSS